MSTSDLSPEERAAASQVRRAELREAEKRRAADGRVGRIIGWLLVAAGLGAVVLGFVVDISESDRARRLELQSPDFPVAFLIVAGFLILIGVIVIVGNRRRA